MGMLDWLANIPAYSNLTLKIRDAEAKAIVDARQISDLQAANTELRAVIAEKDKQIDELREALRRCEDRRKSENDRKVEAFNRGPQSWMA